MIIRDPKLTARQAAEQFVKTNWLTERTIRIWKGNRFQLVDGIRWYEILPIENGWKIGRIETKTRRVQVVTRRASNRQPTLTIPTL